MINELRYVLGTNLPAELEIVEERGSLKIRDRTVDRSRGYAITITRELGHIEARIEFESFAGQLATYSAQQIIEQRDVLREVLGKFDQLNLQLVSQATEDIIAPESRKEDIWWLNLYCKLENEQQKDYLFFADILLSLIFLLLPYEMEGSIEGTSTEETSKFYERSKVNRALCLAFHGYDCKACGINMRRTYTDLNNDFIHVHHLNPVASAGVKRPDPIKDMIPLCPNCHSVAHLRNPPYQLSELKYMIQHTL
jgi:hypothetical protein